MPNSFLTAERIVSTALGLLVRELTLPRLVTRDAAGDFAGAKSDTISIRLPAFAPARSRGLRSGDTRTRDLLTERKVDVTLDLDVYKDVKITDAQLSLDITDFGRQVLNPMMVGITQALEEDLATLMAGATYARSIAFTYATGNFWKDVVVPAREYLNKANVPMVGRTIALGSALESAALKTDLFVQANQSGGTGALAEGTLGRKAGFDFVSSAALKPDEAFAFHRTAYVLNQRAPSVPAGAPWGSSQSFDGFALRAVRILDSATIEDVIAMDAWIGTNIVPDAGVFDVDGKFIPSEGEVGAAVTLANPSAALDDIIDTAAAHGYVAGDIVVFPTLTGGTGLVVGRRYYVIAANLAATTFQVSLTAGGAAVNFTTDITAGTVRKNGFDQFVRAVKITGS